MSINDLIMVLEEMANEHGGDTPVVIAHQEAYPLRERIHGVAAPYDIQSAYDETKAANPELSYTELLGIVTEDEGPFEVTIVAGGHPTEGAPYANRDLWERAQR